MTHPPLSVSGVFYKNNAHKLMVYHTMMVTVIERHIQREMSISKDKLSPILLIRFSLKIAMKGIKVVIIQKKKIKKHDYLDQTLWNMFTCTFCRSPHHCVAKCRKRKSLFKRLNMSIGKETSHEEHFRSPDGKKDLPLKGKR